MERYPSYSELRPFKPYTLPLHRLLASKETLMSVGAVFRPSKRGGGGSRNSSNMTSISEYYPSSSSSIATTATNSRQQSMTTNPLLWKDAGMAMECDDPILNESVRLAAIEELKRQILTILGRTDGDDNDNHHCNKKTVLTDANIHHCDDKLRKVEGNNQHRDGSDDYLNCLDFGETPLYIACNYHSVEIILFLLSLGADPTLCVNGRDEYDTMTKNNGNTQQKGTLAVADGITSTPTPQTQAHSSSSTIIRVDDAAEDEEGTEALTLLSHYRHHHHDAGNDECCSEEEKDTTDTDGNNNDDDAFAIRRAFYVGVTVPSNDFRSRLATMMDRDNEMNNVDPENIRACNEHLKDETFDDLASFLFCEREFNAGRDLFIRYIAKRYYDRIGLDLFGEVRTDTERVKEELRAYEPPAFPSGDHISHASGTHTFASRFCYRLLPLQCVLERGFGRRSAAAAATQSLKTSDWKSIRLITPAMAITLIDAFIAAGARFGFDINAVDGFGFTAMSVACRTLCGYTTAVAEHLLLRCGAHAMYPPPRMHLLHRRLSACRDDNNYDDNDDTAINNKGSGVKSPPLCNTTKYLNTLPRAYSDAFPRNAEGYFIQGPDFIQDRHAHPPPPRTGPHPPLPPPDVLEGYSVIPNGDNKSAPLPPQPHLTTCEQQQHHDDDTAANHHADTDDICFVQRADMLYRCPSPFYYVTRFGGDKLENPPLMDVLTQHPFFVDAENDLPPNHGRIDNDDDDATSASPSSSSPPCPRNHPNRLPSPPPPSPTIASLSSATSQHPYYTDYFSRLPAIRQALERPTRRYRPCPFECAVINCIGLFVVCGNADIHLRSGGALPHRSIFGALNLPLSPFLFHSLVVHFGADPFGKVVDELAVPCFSIKVCSQSLIDGALPAAVDHPDGLREMCIGRGARWNNAMRPRCIPLHAWRNYWVEKLLDDSSSSTNNDHGTAAAVASAVRYQPCDAEMGRIMGHRAAQLKKKEEAAASTADDAHVEPTDSDCRNQNNNGNGATTGFYSNDLPYPMPTHILTNEEAFRWLLDVYFEEIARRCGAPTPTPNGGNDKSGLTSQRSRRQYFYACVDAILGGLVDAFSPDDIVYFLAMVKSLAATLFGDDNDSADAADTAADTTTEIHQHPMKTATRTTATTGDSLPYPYCFSPTALAFGGMSPIFVLLTRRFPLEDASMTNSWETFLKSDCARTSSTPPLKHWRHGTYGIKEMIYDVLECCGDVRGCNGNLLSSSQQSLLAPTSNNGGYPAIFYIPLAREVISRTDRSHSASPQSYYSGLFGTPEFARLLSSSSTTSSAATFSASAPIRRSLHYLQGKDSSLRRLESNHRVSDRQQNVSSTVGLLSLYEVFKLFIDCGVGVEEGVRGSGKSNPPAAAAVSSSSSLSSSSSAPTALALACVKFLIREWHLACTFSTLRDHCYYEPFMLLRRSIVEIIAELVGDYGADADALYTLLLHHYPEEGVGSARHAAVEIVSVSMRRDRLKGEESDEGLAALNAEFAQFYDCDVGTLDPQGCEEEMKYWQEKDVHVFTCHVSDAIPCNGQDLSEEEGRAAMLQRSTPAPNPLANDHQLTSACDNGSSVPALFPPNKDYAFHACRRSGVFRPMVSARGGVVDGPINTNNTPPCTDSADPKSVNSQQCCGGTTTPPIDRAAAALNFLVETALAKKQQTDRDASDDDACDAGQLSLAQRRRAAVEVRRQLATHYACGGLRTLPVPTGINNGSASSSPSHSDSSASASPSAVTASSLSIDGADAAVAAYYHSAGASLIGADAVASAGDRTGAMERERSRCIQRRPPHQQVVGVGVAVSGGEVVSLTTNATQDLWAVVGEQTLLFYMLHVRGGAPRHRRALPDEYIALVKSGVWASAPPPGKAMPRAAPRADDILV